jgi:hypothetical protein
MPEEGPAVAAKMLSRLHAASAMTSEDMANTYTNRFALKAKARLRA